VALERDNFQGAAAAHKRGFVVDLRRTGPDDALIKRPVVDLLDLADPDLISLPARAGDIGLGDPFAMPYVTIEAVLPLHGSRLAIVNDTTFGSTGRNPRVAGLQRLRRRPRPGSARLVEPRPHRTFDHSALWARFAAW
jgi:hypothetical protein